MADQSKVQESSELVVEGTEAQRCKNQAALQLFHAWRTEDAQEQAETWTAIQAALEADRLSDRPLFQ
jgi:hypothetical protein